MNTLITVVSVVGQVWAVAANGARRLVQKGEQLLVSETLVLAPGAQVNLDFGDNRVVSLVGEQTSALEPISGQVAQMPSPDTGAERNVDAPMPAQNSQTQPSSDGGVMTHGHRFVQLVRIAEVVESDGVEEALLKVAESYVQLLTPTRDDSPVAKAIEKRGEGLHHIGYRVADCAEAYAAMVAAGATPIDAAPRPGSRGTTVAFMHPKGSFGTLIELVQE